MSRETILVVDDEESIRKSLVDIFTDEGYEVLTAGSGAEGVEMLRKYQPALAIIDVVLPGSDGLEILQQFKEIRPAKVRPSQGLTPSPARYLSVVA